jgi:hypothetical protein
MYVHAQAAVADWENVMVGRRHITEHYFYLAYILNFYTPIKDKILISIWTNDKLKNTFKKKKKNSFI